LLRYLIFPEGIPLHVGPGNISKRIGGIEKMAEKQQVLLESLEYEEVTRIDKDGNAVTVKIY
jgi:hypothetical protein